MVVPPSDTVPYHRIMLLSAGLRAIAQEHDNHIGSDIFAAQLAGPEGIELAQEFARRCSVHIQNPLGDLPAPVAYADIASYLFDFAMIDFGRIFCRNKAPRNQKERASGKDQLGFAFKSLATSPAEARCQIILAGAGLSTRAGRLKAAYYSTLQRARIFELDLPANQQEKIRRLRQCSEYTRDAAVYVPCDLAEQSLREILRAPELRFRYDIPTLMICDGLLMYLPKEQVINMLTEFNQGTFQGSAVFFNCKTRQSVEPAPQDKVRHEVVSFMSELGSNYLWHDDRYDSQTEQLAAQCGLIPIHNKNLWEFCRYLANSIAPMSLPLFSFSSSRFVVAVKPDKQFS